VVLDEIGRGTATFTLEHRVAVAEYLATNAKVAEDVVRTHYHELTDLADAMPVS